MSKKRIKNKLVILLIMVLFSALLLVAKGAYIDQIICIVVVDIVFYAVLSFLLEHERTLGRLSSNKTTDFRRIVMAVFLASIIAFVCGFCPEFTRPMVILPILFIIFTSEWIAFCLSLFYLVCITITCGIDANEAMGYLLLILAATMILLTWEGANKKYYVAILFALQTIIPPLFFYIDYQEAPLYIIGISTATALFLALFLYLFMERFLYIREVEIEDILENMLDREYHVAKELKQFSKQEYEHACRVSELSRNCAKLIDADELVCAAAGFYYRIGILEGDQIAENGYKYAIEKCFPEAVCNIIYEYQGMIKHPSSEESAIVQMVDGVCRKMELLTSQPGMTDWNQDMAIYKIVNDFSTTGMYEESTLSMNKYLKIRDYLVKENFVS